MAERSNVDRLLRAGFIAALAIVGAYLVISAFEPLRLNWGDPWSDSNAMTSGGHFAREGFFNLAFTPRVDIGPIGPETLIYTHYPPLPDLVNGFLQTVTGGDHLALFRLFALILTGLSLFFFHAYLQRVWSTPVARVSTVVMATNLLWLQYTDTLHHIPLYTMTGYAVLAGGARYLDEQRTRVLIGVGIATFFCFLASYDYYFFVPIMTLATVKFRKHRWFGGAGFKLVFTVAFFGFLSIVVKNLLAIWAVGVDAWWKDIIFQFYERATHEHAHPYKDGLGPVIFWRIWRFFSPLFYVCVIVQLVALVDWARGRKPDISFSPLIFLLAGIPFVKVFSQLIVEQYHPTLLFLPYAAVAIGSLVATCWERSRFIAAALMAIYLGWQGFQFKIFKKTFLYEQDVVEVRKVLANDKHNFLMTNMLVDAPSRYYWNRYAIGIIVDPVGMRRDFERFGAESPFTVVQVKHVRPHAYDKGIYMWFVGERRWNWIARPDYYRNTWGKRFDKGDQELDEVMEGLGTVVYESKELRVRQITRADVDVMHLKTIPKEPVRFLDFESGNGDDYKWSGVGPRNAPVGKLPGFAWLYGRQPQRIIFTLQGFGFPKTAPPIQHSELRIPIKPGKAAKVTLGLSTPIFVGQELTISVNGHPLLKRPLFAKDGVVDYTVDIPAELLAADGLQAINIAYAKIETSDLLGARLHRLEVAEACAP